MLMNRDNQFKFLACEGFELMMRCLKEQKYVSCCVVSVLSYATLRNKPCCERLIDVGGLKYVFSFLMVKGIGKNLVNNKKVLKEKAKEVEEKAITLLSSICTQLSNSKVNDYGSRILHKFLENEYQKLEYCIELYAKYFKRLLKTEQEIERTRQMLYDSNEEEELELFDEESNIYNQVNILFLYHQIDFAFILICYL